MPDYKLDELQETMESNAIDLACVTETWCTDLIPGEAVIIPGYTMISRLKRLARVRCWTVLLSLSAAFVTWYSFTQTDGNTQHGEMVDVEGKVQRGRVDLANGRVTVDLSPLDDAITQLPSKPTVTASEDFIPTDGRIAIVRGTPEYKLMRMLNEGAHILLMTRFGTGSSLAEEFFARDRDFFGVHEPGGMIQRSLGLPKSEETPSELDKIREQLLRFMHDIYRCNLKSHQYFYGRLDENVNYLADSRGPVNNDMARRVCRDRQNKIITTCRLYDVFDAEELITENNVKVVVFVRDPRGLISSRMSYLNMSSPDHVDNAGTKVKIHPKMVSVAIEYCNWIKRNFIVPSTLPEWLRGRYLLMRFEDLEAEPAKFLRYLYDFAGVRMDDDIFQFTDEPRGEYSQLWRWRLNLQQATAIQEMCGRGLFRNLGYKLAYNTNEMLDRNISFFIPLKSYMLYTRRDSNR
ncbi:carbohydrate sulfotransferase 1-like [Ptychodera flava]|uniref:carbohydrate sulfotransferase 1-like n=1 Tax=Ptychodera flava TaxID=63121 RepID=UPI00396A079F